MADAFDPDGATPLTPDETAGLIPSFVATRSDLNLVEQANIASGRRWALGRAPRTPDVVLDDAFVRELHRRMFGQVWRWAGQYRTTERNIGVDPTRVATGVRDLVGDARFWVAPGTAWITPERAVVRVHHQMVALHPFPNGNGRHARLLTDVLGRALGLPVFTWGAADLDADGPDRAAYLAALRAADRDPDELDALLAFARS
ncbi:mobile mystery protein B [Cellulomonas sp. S1-8]|uniref:mobile mystery protein B n=1 Tax=Cellulomonas sp. S1-8 TaxID=2904790 RepID=UPI002243BBD6|nr:mobile mystery protein B [Cellulomonas sp. S1-8]UZN02523.1 mobile mystery protein B [Cellulomonas sp. S1-8]